MPLKVINSSTLPLNLTNYKWVELRQTKTGLKLHLRPAFMDKETVYPEKTMITNAIENDRLCIFFHFPTEEKHCNS